jgi:hypothetical protein
MLTAVIASPQDGDVIVGPAAAAVTFAGSLSDAAPGGATLLRWWSTVPPDPWALANLPTPVQLDTIAIAPQSSKTSLTAALRVGSQAITLAVKDRPGDTEADLKQVVQAASAGGGPGTPHPCVVHVVVADPHLPPPGAGGVVTLRRAVGLWAQAPANWTSPEYAKLNRISYAWTFAPSGGGAPVTIAPKETELSFQAAVPSTDPAQRVPPLVGLATVPAQVPNGSAALTLTVSATGGDGTLKRHQSQVSVQVAD